jgi:hypothetical protein
MNRAPTLLLYLALAAVVASEINTLRIAFTDPERFARSFPAAGDGIYFYVTVATSAAAGLNSILIAFRHRWALLTNAAIGVWSIVLVRMLGGPTANQIVIACACAATTLLPLVVWRKQAKKA